ncbi:MAG: hypothetical protein JSW11_15210 [Candidatus Heimdallarchaeota archaeon]|nr:MAG: hypothetical protein JSW11_15210 [Candidatus Heimdallarchaeota archaeon]
MSNDILLYVGAIIPIFWGIAHIFPTNSVLKDFGDISDDNKNILKMEWLNESLTLVFIGILIILVTFLGDSTSYIAQIVYWLSALMLVAMAVLSLMTGFKVDFLPFKLCPLIFGVSAIVVILGAIL